MKPNYRRCLSCRKIASKNSFLRIVRVHPSDQIKIEEGRGRSAYLCPQEDCLSKARQKNRLGRSLRATIPEEIYQSLTQRVTKNLKANQTNHNLDN
jgi:hypothetical protein